MNLQETDINGIVTVIVALASIYAVFRALKFIETLILHALIERRPREPGGEVQGAGWVVKLPARFAMAAVLTGFAYGVLSLIVQLVSPVPIRSDGAVTNDTASPVVSAAGAGSAFSDFFIPSAYAEEAAWTYFGFAKNSDLWNYIIVVPASATSARYLSDLDALNSSGATIKAKKEMNFRTRPFGTFTGTFLNFLTPEPPVIPNVKANIGSCYSVKEALSVGFSKVWVKVALPAIQCPGA